MSGFTCSKRTRDKNGIGLFAFLMSQRGHVFSKENENHGGI